jgi:hypothetical protein
MAAQSSRAMRDRTRVLAVWILSSSLVTVLLELSSLLGVRRLEPMV